MHLSPPDVECAVEEWCDVEEDCGGVPLAQSGHAHRQHREEQEERVGEGERAQPVAEHLSHLIDVGKVTATTMTMWQSDSVSFTQSRRWSFQQNRDWRRAS